MRRYAQDGPEATTRMVVMTMLASRYLCRSEIEASAMPMPIGSQVWIRISCAI